MLSLRQSCTYSCTCAQHVLASGQVLSYPALSSSLAQYHEHQSAELPRGRIATRELSYKLQLRIALEYTR